MYPEIVPGVPRRKNSGRSNTISTKSRYYYEGSTKFPPGLFPTRKFLFVFCLVVISIIFINRGLSHRTITVCHFISDYNAVRRLSFFWTTTVPRHVLIVILGVHVSVVLTRTPLLNETRR